MPRNTLVAMATKADRQPRMAGGHSPFAEALLRTA